VFRKGEIQQLRTTARDTLSRAIGNHVQGVVRVVESFLEAYVEVLCFGLAMPIVCGFVWLILLRLFAGVIIYTLIILLGFAMVVFTAYCFLLAGAFDSLFSANITLGVSNTSVPSWANDTLAMALGLVTDFTLVQNGEELTSDNRRLGDWLMLGDGNDRIAGSSSQLSPADVHHFQSVALPSKRKEQAEIDTGFVLIGHGIMEASASEPLSPSDRKLYYKRSSFSSPKVTHARDPLPPPEEDEGLLTPAFLSS